ncbi:unnamed protein product [Diamesa hyperborea]
MSKPFKGMIFAKGFSEECGSIAGKIMWIYCFNFMFIINHFFLGASTLTLPTQSCGIRSQLKDNQIHFSVRIVTQMSDKLQQKSDLETIARCTLPTEMMEVSIQEKDNEPKQRNGRMRFLKAATKIRSWLELGGKDGSLDVVDVGQNATLSIKTILARNIGIRVVDCVAFDGIGESSQKLFDENGCPVDSQIMPEFLEEITIIEDGWSKKNDDDMVQKVFKTNFQAFKFPDRDIVHVNCGVHLCKGKCAKYECFDKTPGKTLKPLGRIEVFNSLKVIAPQIEIDQQPREKNFIDTGFPSAQSSISTSSDVLCISQSKLAMAFCILGMIFLIAVIVAVFCSLRYVSLRKNRPRLVGSSQSSGRRSIFSVVSSSSPSQSSLDIDSKLFSYGRVY